MIEYLAALGGAFLWLGVYGMLVVTLRATYSRSLASAALFAYPLFYALQILMLKSLDLAGALHSSGVTLGFAALLVGGGGVILARKRRLPDFRMKAQPSGDEDRLIRGITLVTAGLVVAGTAFFSLVVPIHVWDVLSYHMPMVANYVQTESLDPLSSQDPRHYFRVNGAELQMASLAFISRSDAWLELPGLLALIVALIAVYRLAEQSHGSREIAFLCVVATLTVPQILIGAGTAKNDLIFLALVLSALYLTIRLVAEAGTADTRLPLALALIAGLAAATKVMGINLIGAVGLTLLIFWLTRRMPFRHVLIFGAASVVLLLVFSGDVYWRNFGEAAVPVGVAPGEVRFAFGLENFVAAAGYYVYELGFERLVAPQVYEHDFSHFGYLYPILLLFGVAAIGRQAFVARARRKNMVALALLCVILFLSVIAVRIPIRWDQRFMTWIVPAAAVLSALWLRRARPFHLLALTSFCAALSLAMLLPGLANESDGLFLRAGKHVVQTGHPAQVLDVPPDRYAYRHEGMAALERQASPEDSILYVGGDDTWMYLAWGPRFTRHVQGVRDASDLRAKLSSGRFSFVVVEPEANPDLRSITEQAVVASSYSVLAEVDGRAIYERDTGISGAPKP